MRSIFYIFVLTIFASGCKVPDQSNLKNTQQYHSEKFVVNGNNVFWNIRKVIYKNDTLSILELKNVKTNKVLLRDTLEYEEITKFPEDHDFSNDFRNCNFDSYDDYVSVFHLQNSRTNNFKIYAYNPKLKLYEFLLDGDDLEIDTIKKTVSSSWFSQISYSNVTYHFKNGKVDFKDEEYHGYIQDSDGLQENIYTKSKENKVIYIKSDTTKIE